MFEKDGITYESEEEYLHRRNELNEKKPLFSKGFVTVITYLLVITVLPMIIFFIAMSSTVDNYTHFSKRRIAEMEERFNITVTDDFELTEYKRHSWQGTSLRLEIEGIEDYSKFLENNVNGVVEEYEKSDDNKSASYKYVCTEKDEITGREYELDYSIVFMEEADGTYSAVITN